MVWILLTHWVFILFYLPATPAVHPVLPGRIINQYQINKSVTSNPECATGQAAVGSLTCPSESLSVRLGGQVSLDTLLSFLPPPVDLHTHHSFLTWDHQREFSVCHTACI
jgi:hypothetical protein